MQRNILQFDQALGLAFGGREIDLRRRAARSRIQVRQFADHLARLVDAGFRLSWCAPSRRDAAIRFPRGPDFPALPAAWIARAEILLSFRESAVVAVDAEQSFGIDAVQFDHVGGDIFEEIAVVADDHAGEGRFLEQIFEPRDSRQDRDGSWVRPAAGCRDAAPELRRSRGASASRRITRRRRSRFSKPARPRVSAKRAPRSVPETPPRSAALSMTERTVAPASNRESCSTQASRVRFRNDTSPLSASTSPARIRRRVDLPDPFGPIRPMRSPSEMVNETFWKSGFAPKAFVISCALTMGGNEVRSPGCLRPA